jgi:muramoyltetrapeptide carboxypeptidase
MNRPKRLEKGDTIGVISPASPSEKKSEVQRGVETLEEWGYHVVVGKNVNKTKGFVAASEEERASDFNEMFRRDDIDAVFVTQGGYGSAQIISLLDFDVVRQNPKIFTGFSDITSLHTALNQLGNLVSFHGPGMARFNGEDLTPYTKEQFFKAISDPDPLGVIPLRNPKKWIQTWGEGVAEGTLVGGNLTLLCATLGTPYEAKLDGGILFMEDVDTEPWIFDHMLSHLRNAGFLQKAKGVVVGECKNCKPFKHRPGFYCDISIEDVLEYYLKPLGVPVLFGLPLGHTKDMATLPLGVQVRVDADRKIFEVLESGVR